MTDCYEKIRNVLAECRDIAMEWTMRGRAPECGKFGEIAQDLDALCAELEITDSELTQQPANDEVVFIDGVGAGRSNIKSCRDGVQWIRVGDRVYWPLSDSDAKRLQSACCGNGHFDGPTTPTIEGEQQ